MVVFGGITIIIGVKNYTVVAWNQRGCGSTYYNYKNKDNDLDALADSVCHRFQQENVILVGHSCRTMFGSKYAIEHPNKVAAYVGVGQMGRVGVIFMLTRMLFLLPIKR